MWAWGALRQAQGPLDRSLSLSKGRSLSLLKGGYCCLHFDFNFNSSKFPSISAIFFALVHFCICFSRRNAKYILLNFS